MCIHLSVQYSPSRTLDCLKTAEVCGVCGELLLLLLLCGQSLILSAEPLLHVFIFSFSMQSSFPGSHH